MSKQTENEKDLTEFKEILNRQLRESSEDSKPQALRDIGVNMVILENREEIRGFLDKRPLDFIHWVATLMLSGRERVDMATALELESSLPRTREAITSYLLDKAPNALALYLDEATKA